MASLFEVAELDLGGGGEAGASGLVSRATLDMFEEDLARRSRMRNRKKKLEQQRERRIRAEEDRMLGNGGGIVLRRMRIKICWLFALAHPMNMSPMAGGRWMCKRKFAQ